MNSHLYKHYFLSLLFKVDAWREKNVGNVYSLQMSASYNMCTLKKVPFSCLLHIFSVKQSIKVIIFSVH